MTRARLFPYEAGFPPDWRGWPPHLVPAERELMMWFLTTPAGACESVWYDVRLDGENPRDAQYPAAAQLLDPKWLRAWYTLTARRADAIIERPDPLQIVELRDRAGAQTVGEITLYQHLAQAEWPMLLWGPPIVIARIYDRGVIDTLRAGGAIAITAPANLYDPAKVDTRYLPTNATADQPDGGR
jgi:hypothetical protein